jgi:hypothetical protein
MKKYKVKPKTEEQLLIQEIKKLYSSWKVNKVKSGAVVNVTRNEYAQLWLKSGLWNIRGLGLGKSTFYCKHDLKVISIEDCSVLLRTPEIQAESYKGMPIGTKISADSPRKQAKTRQYIGTVTKPERRVPRKQYIKSEKQMIKELSSTTVKERNKPRVREEELNIAVDNFYDKSSNPLNARIRELANSKVTNHEVINLITGRRIAVKPKIT